MTSPGFAFAVSHGGGVMVSETGVERLQLVGRVGSSTFLLGGSSTDGGKPSGPDPYDLLEAALAACTATTIRLYADRSGFPLSRVDVGVAFERGGGAKRDVFHRYVLLEGDLDERQRERLVEVANLCPVGRSLAAGADIRATLGLPAQTAPADGTDYLRDAEDLPIPNVDW